MVEKAKTMDQTIAGMVYFPAAKFMMGSKDGITTPSDETPRHEVELSAYYFDEYGVTKAEYNAHLAKSRGEGKFKLIATECGSLTQSVVAKGDDARKLFEANKSRTGQCGLHVVLNEDKSVHSNPSPEGFDGPTQPVVNVSWDEATAYCEAEGKRLPTEAEWERAAWGLTKGYDTRRKYGTISGQLNSEEAVYRTNQTANVCSKPKNDAGLCDMAGNTWTWVADRYDEDYYKNSPAKDPKGPTSGELRVVRGGSWNHYNSGYLRASFRSISHPVGRNLYVGFRCALSAAEDPKK